MNDLRQAAETLQLEVLKLKQMLEQRDVIAALRTALEQQQQQQAEPVGEVIDERGEVDYISYVPPVGTKLYTTPPQQQAADDKRGRANSCAARL